MIYLIVQGKDRDKDMSQQQQKSKLLEEMLGKLPKLSVDERAVLTKESLSMPGLSVVMGNSGIEIHGRGDFVLQINAMNLKDLSEVTSAIATRIRKEFLNQGGAAQADL